MKALIAALGLLSAAACGPAHTQPANEQAPKLGVAQTTPLSLTGRVVDAASLIDELGERSLTAKLAALEAATSDQVVVVTVPTLNGEGIEQYGLKLGKRWGSGRADVDNGVIFLVAPTERKVRIEVGLGLEGLLTDAKAAEVIKAMMPRFKAGDFVGGVNIGVDQVDRLLRSDRRRPQPKPTEFRKAA